MSVSKRAVPVLESMGIATLEALQGDDGKEVSDGLAVIANHFAKITPSEPQFAQWAAAVKIEQIESGDGMNPDLVLERLKEVGRDPVIIDSRLNELLEWFQQEKQDDPSLAARPMERAAETIQAAASGVADVVAPKQEGTDFLSGIFELAKKFASLVLDDECCQFSALFGMLNWHVCAADSLWEYIACIGAGVISIGITICLLSFCL